MDFWELVGWVLLGIFACVGALWLYVWFTKPRITENMIQIAQTTDLRTMQPRATPLSREEARKALYAERARLRGFDTEAVAPAGGGEKVWFRELPL